MPPFRLLQADYPSTIIGIQYDSADAFDDCDCADALLQIRGHPFTIPRTPFHDSADTLALFHGHPCTIPQISSAMPWKNCGFPTRTIRGFLKVSCDKYCKYTEFPMAYVCTPIHLSVVDTERCHVHGTLHAPHRSEQCWYMGSHFYHRDSANTEEQPQVDEAATSLIIHNKGCTTQWTLSCTHL